MKRVLIFRSDNFYSEEIETIIGSALLSKNILLINYQRTGEEYTSYNTEDLVVCIGEIQDFELVFAAKSRARIPTVFIEGSLVNSIEKLDILHNLGEFPTYVICSNILQKDLYRTIDINSDRVLVCGNPLLDLDIKPSYTKGKTIFFHKRDLEGYNKVLNKFTKYKLDYSYGPLDKDILARIDASYCVIAEMSDALIYSVMRSKPTVLISEHEADSVRYGVPLLKKVKRISDAKLDLTEDQLSHYLIDFFPGVVDKKNTLRIVCVLEALLGIEEQTNEYSKLLYNKFLDTHPQLRDPLCFIKREAQELFNGLVKF